MKEINIFIVALLAMLLCVPQVRAEEDDYVYDYVMVNDGVATDQNIPEWHHSRWGNIRIQLIPANEL